MTLIASHICCEESCDALHLAPLSVINVFDQRLPNSCCDSSLILWLIERCSKSLCGPETLTKSFREGLRGTSADARVAYASGVHIAKDYAALARIQFVL